jgi:transcriptional regulator with XRE-family HTH domain
MNMDPGTWSRRVAAVVRAEMAARSRSARDLADLLDVTEPTVAARLEGQTSFDLVEVEQVAAWLGIPLSELLARAG